MSLSKVNWNDYVNNMNMPSWKPTVDKHFLDHVLPVLSAIPLRTNEQGKISATRTFNEIPETLKTSQGTFNNADVKRILGFLYTMPRSKLLTQSQGKDSRLGSLTPLAMYAHKSHKDVSYEAWDKKDPMLKYFLGRFLEPLLSTEYTIPVTTTEDIIELRKKALIFNSGAKCGTTAPLTAYKCNVTGISVERYEDDENFDDGDIFMPLPKVVLLMTLQIWIANVALRKPDIMILDPKNWDATPKSIDASSAVVEKVPWEVTTPVPTKTPWS